MHNDTSYALKEKLIVVIYLKTIDKTHISVIYIIKLGGYYNNAIYTKYIVRMYKL